MVELNSFKGEGFNDDLRIAYVGPSKCGKTQLFKRHWNSYLCQKYDYVYVIGGNHIKRQYLSAGLGFHWGNTRIHFHNDELSRLQRAGVVDEGLTGNKGICAMLKLIRKKRDKQAGITDQGEGCWNSKFLVVFDDCIDNGLGRTEEMKKLFMSGRHSGIDTVFIIQEIKNTLTPTIKENLTHMVIFDANPHDPESKKEVYKQMKIDTRFLTSYSTERECNRACKEIVVKHILPSFSFIIIHKEGKRLYCR